MIRILFAFLAAFTLFGCTYKPKFFWEHRKALAMRETLGDTGATIFYIFIAILFIYAAFNPAFNLVSGE